MRESSRREWASRDTVQEIGGGALQRIADAVEKMAQSYDRMRDDRDRWQRRANESQAEAERLARRIAALKGTITRMKRKGVQG